MASALNPKSVLEGCLPDEQVRRAVLRQLLRSAREAADIAPNAWAVTLHQDGFRLNVGQVEALTLSGDWLRVMIVLPAVPASASRMANVHEANFENIRVPHAAYEDSATAYASARSLIEAPHLAFVGHAARSPITGKPRAGSPFRRYHSPELIQYAVSEAGSAVEDYSGLLHLGDGGDTRSRDRLPVEVLRRATPEFVWQAVQKLLSGPIDHQFGPSTDFDLVSDDGRRLPPKAVFGLALSLALGGERIEPRHFTAGEGSACFKLLRQAGFQVVPKGAPAESQDAEDYDDDGREWAEGRERLRQHRSRERASGLAAAKKAQYIREYGSLTCERCGLDPVKRYGTPHAVACIEVHHSHTQVNQMGDGHVTRLQDLQCLCANCHRLVHRILTAGPFEHSQ